MMRKLVMLAALVLVTSPASARADWLLRLTWAARSARAVLPTGRRSDGWARASSGGRRSLPGRQVFSTSMLPTTLNLMRDELDADLFDNKAMTVMFNGIVGVPIGGTSGSGFRPYFAGGLGWFQTAVESEELLFEESSDKFGFSLGGGAMGTSAMSASEGTSATTRRWRSRTSTTPSTSRSATTTSGGAPSA